MNIINELSTAEKNKKTAKYKYVVYIYDIKTGLVALDKKNYNTTKRRFYIDLAHLSKRAVLCRTESKSMIIVLSEYESEADGFFRKYRRWISLYKIFTSKIHEML